MSDIQPATKESSLQEKQTYFKKLIQICLYEYLAFGQLLHYIPREVVEDSDHVGYTDGKSIHFGNEFFRFSPGQQAFIILHEVLHVVLRHPTRAKQFIEPKDRMLWNCVTDCIINYALGSENPHVTNDLKKLEPPQEEIFNFTSLSKLLEEEVPPYQEYGDTRRDWSAEELFKHVKRLIDNSDKKEEIEQKLGQMDQQLRGQASGGESMPSTLGDLAEEELGDGGADPEEDLPQVDSGRVGDMVWEQRVRQAAGNDPSGALKQLLGDLPKPNTDWRKVLRDMVATKLQPVYVKNWRRPSRRTPTGNPFFPARDRKRGVKNIVVFHDASGSCWDEKTVREFLGNIQDIQQKMKANLTYIPFDADIAEPMQVPYTGRTITDMLEAGDLEVRGGGGTSFDPPMNWLKQKEGDVDVAVMLTDTYAPMPERKPQKTPFIWAVVDNEQFVPPFGKMVYIEPALNEL